MRPDLPTGTVTFVFTDVEGSTRLLHELGAEGYAVALEEHRRVLLAAFAGHGGVEVDTQGDAFFVAFPTAPGALAAAGEAQAVLAAGAIRVRVGVHTGTPLLASEGYVGVDVHRAARIAAAGHGGQVLVSASTAALVEAALRDLGEHRLKDLSAPERLFQLGDGEFPPLKTLYRTNLPVPATPFLGRERELAEVAALLTRDDVRLLTLTGPGGTGKTRLALQAAGEAVEAFPDGVFWVGLAPLRNADLVLLEVAQVLQAKRELHGEIADKRLLLLLDNFEHVLEAAGLLAELLGRCPNLTLLVTSRELLRLAGEREYVVPTLVEEEAVALFRERAVAAEPEQAVRAVCARLDFLPLAVELAAARTKVLPPVKLLERLDRALPLLTGGPRDSDERQRTLRATIEWSHQLLSAEEQLLFARLAVFAGGCTLEAAEGVCGAQLDALESLLDKSLVRRTGERYWMLETIREYATEQLEASGEGDELRRRHARFFLALAESANLSVERMAEGTRHELVRPEGDNLRAAFDTALGAGDVELAGSIVVALEQHWVTSNPNEGARRADELLAHESALPPHLHARALRVRGGMTFIVGNFEEGTRWHERALDEFRRLGDDRGVAHMLMRLAVEAARRGDSTRAKTLCEESLALDGRPVPRALVLDVLGTIAFAEGRGDEALELLAESASLTRETGVQWLESHSLMSRGEFALRLGRPREAAASLHEGVELAAEIGDRQWIFYGLTLIAWFAAAEGHAEDAGRLWGALEAEAERAPVGQWELDRDDYAPHVVSATPDFGRGFKEGRGLSLDEAVQRALGAS
jgi:predicted ATPase/class 3 adenylate cyclase